MHDCVFGNNEFFYLFYRKSFGNDLKIYSDFQMEYWDFLYWKEELPLIEDIENDFTFKTEEGLERKRPSFFQSTPNNTYAIPWKSACPEYRPVRFYIQPEEVLKELDEFQLFSPLCSALCVDEDAHPPTPFSGIPPAKASPASFHRELVAQLHEKLRSSPDMGNRGSSSSNAPSPDKKPSGTGQSGKSSKETPKSVKTENKNAKGSKIQNSSEKIPCRSPPKDLLLGSESGDSLVSSCSQNSNRNGVGRVDSTPSPDTSSMSSSLFVDVQEKFSGTDEQGTSNETNSLSEFSPPPVEQIIPVLETVFCTPEEEKTLQSLPPPELEEFDKIEEDDEDDFEDCNFHDTLEDASDSSEQSPIKEYSPERRRNGTRSCPGTPDTHHSMESNMFCQYRERKGSLGNMCRSPLPTIGSVPRLDLRAVEILSKEACCPPYSKMKHNKHVN
ncbi:DEP domain-containing protein [Trichonephila inaurata madagascariensis]|uniref:DEP domain-containing protein n=1 Tax=Trichonephila inaurata madagascariensis TaxID=2747483 RepID=A0A8X7BQB1_9ARAC|nr:DEP domain-containing protein [Trichonephila inaurata madagascariensis]